MKIIHLKSLPWHTGGSMCYNYLNCHVNHCNGIGRYRRQIIVYITHGTPSLTGTYYLNGTGAWMNIQAIILWHIFTHPCPNSCGGLANSPLKLGHGWSITSHKKQWRDYLAFPELQLTFINTADFCLKKRNRVYIDLHPILIYIYIYIYIYENAQIGRIYLLKAEL